MKMKAITKVVHDGKEIEPGETFEVEDAQGEALEGVKAAEKVPGKAEKTEKPPAK